MTDRAVDIDMDKIMQSQQGYGIGHEDMPCACSISSEMIDYEGQEITYETPWIDIIDLTDETDPGKEKYKKAYDEANHKFRNQDGCDI